MNNMNNENVDNNFQQKSLLHTTSRKRRYETNNNIQYQAHNKRCKLNEINNDNISYKEEEDDDINIKYQYEPIAKPQKLNEINNNNMSYQTEEGEDEDDDINNHTITKKREMADFDIEYERHHKRRKLNEINNDNTSYKDDNIDNQKEEEKEDKNVDLFHHKNGILKKININDDEENMDSMDDNDKDSNGSYSDPLSSQNLNENVSIKRNNDIIKGFIESFLSDNEWTQNRIIIDDIWTDLDRKYKERAQKRKDIEEYNNKSGLYMIGMDVLCHIVEYGTINDYAFNILQTTKYLHHKLGPYLRPLLLRNLLMNEGQKRWFGQPFLSRPVLLKIDECENIFAPFMEKHDTEQMEEIKNITNDPLLSWQISASFAWNNYDRTIMTKEDIIKIFEKNPKEIELDSSRFLLHFLHKCRYGEIAKCVELKQLLLQILANGMGAIGVRCMIYFFFLEYFINPINDKMDIDVDINDGTIKWKRDLYKFGDIEDFLKELHDDSTFIKVLYYLAKVLWDHFDVALQGSKYMGYDPCSLCNVYCDLVNVRVFCWKIFNKYNSKIINPYIEDFGESLKRHQIFQKLVNEKLNEYEEMK